MTDPTFDPRLANRLRAYAEGGVRPIDAIEIAEAAIATTTPRRGPHRGLILLAAALLVTGGVAAALAAGSRLMDPGAMGSIAFSTTDAGARSVWRFGAAGGLIAEPVARMTDAEVSPDGRHAAYLAGDGVHIVDTATGRTTTFPDSAARSLALEPGLATSFAWSTGGRWVSWVGCAGDTGSGTCMLVVGATDGTTSRPMPSPHAPTAGPSTVAASDIPTWFWYDDVHLAVIASHGLDDYVVDGDGSGIRPGAIGAPDLQHWRITNQNGLVLYDARGSASREVAWWPLAPAAMAWSPDLSMLAVDLSRIADDRHPSGGPGPLSLVAADGTHREVDLGSGLAPIGSPVWSPDGSRVLVPVAGVAAAGAGSGPTDAVIVSVADGQTTRIDDAANVTWSPDGSWLALTRPSSPHQVEIVGADGTGRHAVGPIVSGAIDGIGWSGPSD